MPSCRYLRACWKMLPAVTPKNPNYKQQVGDLLHAYVVQMVGEKFAAEVTGTLIECPIYDIAHMMENFFHFKLRVMQVFDLLQDCAAEPMSDCESVASTTESMITDDSTEPSK